MEIRFIGHATFELAEGDATVLVDPFLAPHNPAAKLSAEQVEPTHILVTHGHMDHIADAAAVAKRTGAHCVAVTELARWLGEQGVEDYSDTGLGGTASFGWGSVKLVPAWHTNTTPDGTAIGPATGLMIEIGGVTVYHLGDTALFGDLRLIGERHAPDVALVPIGGHFTMDRHDAAYAVRADRRADRDPLPLQHLRQDRDRRRGVQGRGRIEDALRGRSLGARSDP